MRQVLAFSLLVINWGFETLNNVFTVIQLVRGKARIRTKDCLFLESAPFTPWLWPFRIILGLNWLMDQAHSGILVNIFWIRTYRHKNHSSPCSSSFASLDQPTKGQFPLCHWVSLCPPSCWEQTPTCLHWVGVRPLSILGEKQPGGALWVEASKAGQHLDTQQLPRAQVLSILQAQIMFMCTPRGEQKKDWGEGRRALGSTKGSRFLSFTASWATGSHTVQRDSAARFQFLLKTDS